jgi:hypothetical protein
MPTLPPVPGVVKTVITGTISGASFANIFHWQMDTTGGLSNAQATQIATGVLNAYNSNVTLSLSPVVIVDSCDATDLTSTSGGVGTHTNAVTGSGTTGTPSANTCCLVKHVIARRYRGGHPRTYLPPMGATALLSSNTWQSGGVSVLQTNFNAFITGALGTTVTGNTIAAHVNVSYYSAHVLRSSPVVDLISGSIVESMVATQRRRVGR